MKKNKVKGNNRFYSVMYSAFARLVRCVFRIEIIGAENEPKQECGMIVCGNHLSFADPVIIGASLTRQVHFLAKRELFKVPLLGKLIRAFGAYPISRGSADVGAIKKTIELAGSGECVGMFPQGTRCIGVMPTVESARSGIGMISAHTDAVILPVAIVTKNFKVRPFCKTRIVIGKPITRDELAIEEHTDEKGKVKVRSSEYKRVSERVFGDVVALAQKYSFSVRK